MQRLALTLLTATLLPLAATRGSELDTLRQRCTEQERQIRDLEAENARLKAELNQATGTSETKTTPATPAGKTDTQADKPAAPAAPPAGSTVHVITETDTYYAIARRYNTTIQRIIDANPGVDPTRLRPGQKIVVPNKSTAKTGDEPAAKTTAKSGDKTSVKPDDKTTSKTGDKTTAKSGDKTSAKGGDKPATGNSDTSAKTGSSNKPTAATPADPDADSKPKIRSITVQEQLTFGEFAAKYGTSVEKLNALNGLTLSKTTVLAKGSELYVPVTTASSANP